MTVLRDYLNFVQDPRKSSDYEAPAKYLGQTLAQDNRDLLDIEKSDSVLAKCPEPIPDPPELLEVILAGGYDFIVNIFPDEA